MTFPVVESITKNGGGNGSTTQNVALPATINSGDLVIIFLNCSGNEGGAFHNAVSCITSGWTQLARPTGAKMNIVVYRFCNGTEGGTNVGFNVGNDFGFLADTESWIIHRISGVDTGTAPFIATVSSGGSTSPDPPNLNPGSAADYLWIIGLSTASGNSRTLPSGWTNDNEQATSSIVHTGTQNLNASSLDPAAFGGGNASSVSAFTIAVAPNASPSATGADTLQQLQASATGVEQPSASGVDNLLQLQSSGVGDTPPSASGSPQLSQLQALGSGFESPVANGSPSLPQLQATSQGISGYYGSGTPTLPSLTALIAGISGPYASGNVTLQKIRGSGAANPANPQSFTAESQIVKWVQPIASAVYNQIFTASAQTVKWVLPQAFYPIRRAITLQSAQPYGVFVHSAYWPYQRVKDITRSAWNINRTFVQMDVGQASVNIPMLTEADFLKIHHGQLLVITSQDQPPWVGPIYVIQSGLHDGFTQLQAADMGSILAKRIVAQDERYTHITGSTQLVRNYINKMNGRGSTGISLNVHNEAGPTISDITSGGQTVLDALNQLFDLTDWEWWFEHDVKPGRIRSVLHWGKRQGLDLRNTVQFSHPVHFKDATFKHDLSEGKQVTITLGGFGTPIWERISVAQSTITGIIRPIAGTTRFAPQLIVRNMQDLPAALRDERMLLDVTQNSTPDAIQQTRRKQRRDFEKETSINFTLNNIQNHGKDIAVGNTITIQVPLGDTGFFSGPVRLTQVQPDDELREFDCIANIRI